MHRKTSAALVLHRARDISAGRKSWLYSVDCLSRGKAARFSASQNAEGPLARGSAHCSRNRREQLGLNPPRWSGQQGQIGRASPGAESSRSRTPALLIAAERAAVRRFARPVACGLLQTAQPGPMPPALAGMGRGQQVLGAAGSRPGNCWLPDRDRSAATARWARAPG